MTSDVVGGPTRGTEEEPKEVSRRSRCEVDTGDDFVEVTEGQ